MEGMEGIEGSDPDACDDDANGSDSGFGRGLWRGSAAAISEGRGGLNR